MFKSQQKRLLAQGAAVNVERVSILTNTSSVRLIPLDAETFRAGHDAWLLAQWQRMRKVIQWSRGVIDVRHTALGTKVTTIDAVTADGAVVHQQITLEGGTS